MECFICGQPVSDDDNEGDDDNGLCPDCLPLMEEQYSDYEEFDPDALGDHD